MRLRESRQPSEFYYSFEGESLREGLREGFEGRFERWFEGRRKENAPSSLERFWALNGTKVQRPQVQRFLSYKLYSSFQPLSSKVQRFKGSKVFKRFKGQKGLRRP